jgi:hypothetical protein
LIVRQAYQRMLNWARSLGWPRLPYQTPAMYAKTLGTALPQADQAIDTLTQSYIRARYATDPLSLEEARRAQAVVAQLQVTPPDNAVEIK